MRNLLRVLAFDVAAPLAAVAALLTIGVMLGWPLWWVSVCSILCLLIVQAVVVNVVLFRRDSVTVGTDDDAPCCGWRWWASPPRRWWWPPPWLTSGGPCPTTPSPGTPAGGEDRLGGRRNHRHLLARGTCRGRRPCHVVDDTGERGGVQSPIRRFHSGSGEAQGDRQARTISAGLEALGPSAASVAVLMRGTQVEPGSRRATPCCHFAWRCRSWTTAGRLSTSRRSIALGDVSPINSR